MSGAARAWPDAAARRHGRVSYSQVLCKACVRRAGASHLMARRLSSTYIFGKRSTSVTASTALAAVLTRLARTSRSYAGLPHVIMGSCILLIVPPDHVPGGPSSRRRRELVDSARVPEQLGDLVAASPDCHWKRGLRVCARAQQQPHHRRDRGKLPFAELSRRLELRRLQRCPHPAAAAPPRRGRLQLRSAALSSRRHLRRRRRAVSGPPGQRWRWTRGRRGRPPRRGSSPRRGRRGARRRAARARRRAPAGPTTGQRRRRRRGRPGRRGRRAARRPWCCKQWGVMRRNASERRKRAGWWRESQSNQFAVIPTAGVRRRDARGIHLCFCSECTAQGWARGTRSVFGGSTSGERLRRRHRNVALLSGWGPGCALTQTSLLRAPQHHSTKLHATSKTKV